MSILTFEQYAAVQAVHWTALKKMELSPRHYAYALKHPNLDTPGKLKGRGTHTAVLEPKRFLKDWALFKGKIRRGKEWDAFKVVHPESNILKEAEYDYCIETAEAVFDNEDAAEILSTGKPEQSIEWVDEETGLICKSRIDWLRDDLFADLKGVQSTQLRALGNEIARMRYYAQMAMYQEGIKRALGKCLQPVLICVEHGPEHDVCVAEIGEEEVYLGWELVRALLNKVAECTAADHWPGRHRGRQLVELPSYLWPEEDQIMTVSEVKEEGEAA